MGYEIFLVFFKNIIIITLFKILNYIIILEESRTYYNIAIQVKFIFVYIILYYTMYHYHITAIVIT